MAADDSLYLFFVNIAALHDQLIPDHDRLGYRQPQLAIFIGTIS